MSPAHVRDPVSENLRISDQLPTFQEAAYSEFEGGTGKWRRCSHPRAGEWVFAAMGLCL